MQEVFNSAVDALAQLGSTSHSAEFVDLVSTVDELVRKCIISEYCLFKFDNSQNL
jgi:hypothetical protein